MQNSVHKILVLSSHKLINYFLINKLSKEYNIDLVIYEKQLLRKKFKLIKNRIKKLGLFKVIGQLIFIVFDKIYLTRISRLKIKKLLINENTAQPFLPSIDVNNINEKRVEELIKKIKPEIVVVSGVSVIRPNILSLAKTFINIHCGITPKYRGVHGGFWALYNKDFDNIGVTIHLIDKGVDTGRILYQARIGINPKFDNPQTIAIKQYLRGTDLMIRAINDAFNNNLKPFTSLNRDSFQWYHPTIIEYFKWLKILKKLENGKL